MTPGDRESHPAYACRGRRLVPFLIGGLVRPDADVVGLLGQFDPVPHAEPPDHLARQLSPAGPVQRRVLAGVQRGRAHTTHARNGTQTRDGTHARDGTHTYARPALPRSA